jgi:hypothetical protein
VTTGFPVVAQQTVVGTVALRWNHVHFAEFEDGHAVDPLAPGHLEPYADHTRPEVRSLIVRGAAGRELTSLAVKGDVWLVAEAYDEPPLPVPTPGWEGMPIAPAVVTWQVATLAGRVVVPETTAWDVTRTVPPNRDFWRFYARGTYQNMPSLPPSYMWGMPGRYLFQLTPDGWDTSAVPDGVYTVTVTARDLGGNVGSLTARIRIANHAGAAPPPPEASE